MKVFERYFERNTVYRQLAFKNNPSAIVIVPVLNDRDIFHTLDSLAACTTLAGEVGVVIVVNHSETSDASTKAGNRKLLEELYAYLSQESQKNAHIAFEVIEAFDLPARFAGVGLARKIAMDAAVYYLYQAGKEKAPVLSLDADTLVDTNYLDEVIRFFSRTAVAGVSVAYEHRLEGEQERQEAMIKYELYLRYYRHALEYTGHPYAFSCIGSAFVVRACDYVAQGGMNKRQAGEDFYFLQKLIATGRYADLKSTKVYPSPRLSERTPFGTGQALKQIMQDNGNYQVYHFDSFRALRIFFAELPSLFRADEQQVRICFNRQQEGLRCFLVENEAIDIWSEVNANSASSNQFVKRFFDRFNAFRVLKYLNYVHQDFYSKVDIAIAIRCLSEALGVAYYEDLRDNLMLWRQM